MKSIKLLLKELEENLKCEHIRIGTLALSLIAIDICSKLEYKDEPKQSVRYINWCDSYLIKEFLNPNPLDSFEFNGKFIYQIRCSVLHSGDTDLNEDKLGYKLDFKFSYHRLPVRVNHIYFIDEQSNKETLTNRDLAPRYICYLDIDNFVNNIYNAVLNYYKSNVDKFQDVAEFKFGEIELSFDF